MHNILKQDVFSHWLRSAKPFIPLGSINWYQPRLEVKDSCDCSFDGVNWLAWMLEAPFMGEPPSLTPAACMYGLENSITLPYLPSRRSPLLPVCQSMKLAVCLL
jgi:hypothetical protein